MASAAVMAFATGSSWGTFAICMPIALPLAFSMSGGEVTQLVVAVFAAVAGGGVFGDHCSPCPTPPSCPLWVQAPTTWITLRLSCLRSVSGCTVLIGYIIIGICL